MDSIALEGMVFYAFHGATPEEQALGQRFVVDLEVEADLSRAGLSDNLKETVNYSELFRVVKEVVEGPRKHLLEAVAEHIAAQVLDRFPVATVRVRIRKPSAPIKGAVLNAATVTISRQRRA